MTKGEMETTTLHVIHMYEDLTGEWRPDPSSEHIYPAGFVKGDDGEALSIEEQGGRLAELFGQSDDPMTEMLLLSNRVELEGIERMKQLSAAFKGRPQEQISALAQGITIPQEK